MANDSADLTAALKREALMVGAAGVSWFLTNKSIHEANHFTAVSCG